LRLQQIVFEGLALLLFEGVVGLDFEIISAQIEVEPDRSPAQSVIRNPFVGIKFLEARG